MIVWKRAPNWAEYAAKDLGHKWYFFSSKPEVNPYLGLWTCNSGITKPIRDLNFPWKRSLLLRSNRKNTPISWKEIPLNFSCIARDKDGLWFAYSELPLIVRAKGSWDTYNSDAQLLGSLSLPWEDSLICRVSE